MLQNNPPSKLICEIIITRSSIKIDSALEQQGTTLSVITLLERAIEITFFHI